MNLMLKLFKLKKNHLLRFFIIIFIFVFSQNLIWAAGKKDIETSEMGSDEVWQNNFDISAKKKGTHNYIAYAEDHAGNESVAGPYNIKIDPLAGLPVARIVYPENNEVIRQSINILGVASGMFGVEKVKIRLDDGDYLDVTGTDYWNILINFNDIPDGKHTLFVKAFDSNDLSGPEQSINFILDTMQPNIELTSHKVGEIISGNNVKIKGSIFDINGIKAIELSEDGVHFKPASVRRVDFGHYVFSISAKTKKLPNGPKIYFVRAVDGTGRAAAKPYLFFINNAAPELELFTPKPDEDVYDTVLLSGRAFSNIGLKSVFYEWGKIKEEIPIRQGDPFWSVALNIERNSAKSIKVSAVDLSGNKATVTCKLEDSRKIKTPVLVIDYPKGEDLVTLSADSSIYGHVEPGILPYSVRFGKDGTVEAGSAFRIDPFMIPHGERVQNFRMVPFDQNNTAGTAVSLKYLKQQATGKDISQISINSPEKFAWVSGTKITVSGISGTPGARVEYRFSPQDGWRSFTSDSAGEFFEDIDISALPHGPVHLEFKVGDTIPLYHPINMANSKPEIFFETFKDEALVYGSKTVIGTVAHTVGISNISCSLDGESFEDIPFVSRYGKAWFSFFCDFSSIAEMQGQLVLRITDASGNNFDAFPGYSMDANPPLPSIIVNTPEPNEIITEAFDISGVAFYDAGIKGVYWRFLGPDAQSISPTPAGETAMSAAEAYLENPDIPFNEMLTDQNFQIPVDFSIIGDGEYVLEVYAADTYGVKSETISRKVFISTTPPYTDIVSPEITRYNKKAIMMEGVSDDANGIEQVIISMDSGNTWQKAKMLEEKWRWELPLNTASYSDGIYSAMIRSIDKYGIVTFSNAMVNIDNTPPELYLNSPANGQHIGTVLSLAGRVADNVSLKNLQFQIISGEDPDIQENLSLPMRNVIDQSIDLSHFPQGEYIIRIAATDLADNQSMVSRKIFYDADDNAAQIAIFNPLPGEFFTGTVNIIGTVSSSFLPSSVNILMNGEPLINAPVDRYGVFMYEIPQDTLAADGAYTFSAFYHSQTGMEISSPDHTIYYSQYGPSLTIESHRDGDVITRRPWLSGRAEILIEQPEEGQKLSRRQKKALEPEILLVSYDNGRIFTRARGKTGWKFRMETSLLAPGPQPVVVKAIFADGKEAVRRAMLYVDTTLPEIAVVSPPENSVHRDNLLVYGTAGDNYELANVNVSLRPKNKFFYSVPSALQGLFVDVKTFGSTYFDVGLGLSFFNDNVRFQGQYGIAPPDGVPYGGRYVGHVFGIKLLANIFYLPFSALFGLDWEWLSMNLAVGANFSWFSMDTSRTPLFMSAVVAQLDVANIDFKVIKPGWKYFRNYAVYLEPELWFASSDVQAETIFRMTVGIRINIF